jgi:ribA/ribD-fused uncharacterized protein
MPPSTSAPTEDSSPVYFWHPQPVDTGYLSQWYACAFTAPPLYPPPTESTPHLTFMTAEQFMMYHKALLFEDTKVAQKIMAEPNPRKQKALGRKVKNFDDKKWEEEREKIVEEGNWYKFTCAKEGLKEKLLSTGDRELVEVSV